jgi:hypothetical protein
MEQLIERCCGLDVHRDTVAACVRVPGPSGRRAQTVQTFGTTAANLLALRDWLEAQGVTHVAMESTGVYWRSVYYVFEEGFTCLLVNAAHLKHVPGRKTDVQDCAWIAQVLEHGLVRGSFVPPAPIRELRTSPIQCYSAHVPFRARLHYPWHPACGTDVDVQYREVRRGGEVVLICRVADDTAAVIPAWMFDPGRCAGMAIGMSRASVAALEQIRIILGKLGCDGPATATDAWSQEAADEADTRVAPDPSPDDAVVTAAASAVHHGARSGGTRRRRRARPPAAGGGAARAGGRR